MIIAGASFFTLAALIYYARFLARGNHDELIVSMVSAFFAAILWIVSF